MEEDREDSGSDTASISSLASILPPPTPFKRSIIFLIMILILVTFGELILSCWYSAIAGNATYWYQKPDTWQFCLVYPSTTIQLIDEKLVTAPTTIFANICVFTCIYTWLALCTTFRALFHYEWIPSTIVGLIFIISMQLSYYQSTVLLIVPAQLQTSLLGATKYISSSMFDDLAKWCFELKYRKYVNDDNAPYTYPLEQLQTPGGNCTNEIIIFDSSNSSSPISTMPTSELNCDGAVYMHTAFLVLNYILVAMTIIFLIVLIIGDFKIRQIHPMRRFVMVSKQRGEHDEYLIGAILPQLFTSTAVIGYIMTNVGLCHAAFGAIHTTESYEIVNFQEHLEKSFTQYIGFIPITLTIDGTVDIQYYVKTYLPSSQTNLNMQTILLLVTVMAVIRGMYKQSISAFRLAAVTSLLQVFVQWPAVIGNIIAFDQNDLWWWKSTDECNAFFTGEVYFDPDAEYSKSLCYDSRLAMLGSLIQLFSMHINMVVCGGVYAKNVGRRSIEATMTFYDKWDSEQNLIEQDEPSDNCQFTSLDDDIPQQQTTNVIKRISGV